MSLATDSRGRETARHTHTGRHRVLAAGEARSPYKPILPQRPRDCVPRFPSSSEPVPDVAREACSSSWGLSRACAVLWVLPSGQVGAGSFAGGRLMLRTGDFQDENCPRWTSARGLGLLCWVVSSAGAASQV